MEQGIMLFTNGLLFVCTTGLAKLTNSNYLASKGNIFHIPAIQKTDSNYYTLLELIF